MGEHEWLQEFSGAVTVCDPEGTILEMNDEADRSFRKWGGKQLLGSNLFDCHPEPARAKLAELLATGRSNVYTIEKNGRKKLIYQSPWFEGGRFAGLVEISFEIPAVLPHFKRD